MEESRGSESSEQKKDSELGATAKEPEATSAETVSDLEENGSGGDSSTSAPDPGPSPDGAFDESKETGPI